MCALIMREVSRCYYMDKAEQPKQHPELTMEADDNSKSGATT